jgi:hypothetical protein
MPTRQEAAVVTCAVSVVPTNPTIVPLGFDGGILRVIRIVIPDGHAGLTGIALGYGGNPTIPFSLQAYYSGNDREVIIAYTDNVPGVSWSAFLCNGDLQVHSWEVDMDFDEINVTNASTLVGPVTSDAIIAAGTTAMNGP